MIVRLERKGVPPAPRKDTLDADGWRQWAYDAATDPQAPRLTPPVVMRFEPLAYRRTKRADAAFDVVRLIVDGLVNAGVLADPEDIAEITVVRPVVANGSAAVVTLSDATEPF